MSDIQTQIQLWADFKAQCASAHGMPEFDQYAAHLINDLRTELAAVKAERDKLRAALEQVRDIAVQRYVVASWRLLIDAVADVENIARATLDEGGA